MLIISLTIIIVGLATLWDIKTKRIPNLITFPTIVLGLILNTYYSGLTGLGNALAGMIVGTLLLIIPFAFKGMGAGDVKLLAAVGALNGTKFVFYTFLYGALAGGIIALVLVLMRGRFYSVLLNIFWGWRNICAKIFKHKQQEPLLPLVSNIRFPYGVAIFLGTLAASWVR